MIHPHFLYVIFTRSFLVLRGSEVFPGCPADGLLLRGAALFRMEVRVGCGDGKPGDGVCQGGFPPALMHTHTVITYARTYIYIYIYIYCIVYVHMYMYTYSVSGLGLRYMLR